MSRKTLINTDDRNEILRRLAQVRPDAEAGWGALDAHRMLCHVADQMRVALGEAPAKPAHTPLTRSLVKYIVVHSPLKAPKAKVQTPPEMLTTRTGDWNADMEACRRLIARVGAGEASAVNPKFGPLTPEEWGKLTWKHLDHHLRQFGV